MKYRTTEVLVGVVTLVALGILIGVTVNLKRSTLFSRKYPVNAYFEDVKRLEEGAPVYVHGVVRGDVRRLEATGYKKHPVRVVMMLTTGTLLHQGAEARIVSAGLVGETEINIEDSSPTAPVLMPGDAIYGAPFMDLNELLAQAPSVVGDLRDGISAVSKILSDEKNQQAIANILESASSITVKINQSLGASSTDITEAIRNIRDVTERLNQLVARADSILTTFGLDLSSAGAGLNTMIADFRTSANVLVGRLDSATRYMAEASEKADRLLTTADAILAENRDDARLAVEGLTSASVSLGRILARIDEGRGTLADVLIGSEASADLSRSLDRLEGSLGILSRWLEGLDRWLTGTRRREGVEIPYEEATTATVQGGK